MINNVDLRETLKPYTALIGDWSAQSTHPALGEIKGRVRFEWFTGERFLIQRTEHEHPELPDSICVIGVMEGDQNLSMQYFDSQGIHRLYRISFGGREMQIWRNMPGFSQRLLATLSTNKSILEGLWQLNRDEQGFCDDLAFTYRRST